LYVLLSFIVLLIAASGFNFSSDDAGSTLHDGYYTAEEAEYAHGWKEYITIYVNNGRIVTAEFDGRNRSGFPKSWDMDFMRLMNRMNGTYPNSFSRSYVSALVSRQSTEGIDAVSGATRSHGIFKQLADAAIYMAKTGASQVAFVEIERK
jgi:major membrane immunogen (membrane-anchored lipoprotein)